MNASFERELGEKELEIIAVSASVASGCMPCTKYHVRAAADAGAGPEEVLQAVRDAARVRMAAREIMARAGGLELHADPGPPDGDPSLIRALSSLGAAYAVNCARGLKAHLAEARALGASDRQMVTAFSIARTIKEVAVGKVNAAARSGMGVTKEQAAACGCLNSGAAPAPNASDCAPDSGPCSCHGADAESPTANVTSKEQ